MQVAGTTIATGVARLEVRTPTLPPATHTNSYALGEREVVLVEPATPYEDEQREWLSWARGLISQGRQARAVVLTHHHPDHVGGAELLARELGLPTWAHRETAALLSGLEVARQLDDGDAITLDGPRPQRWQCLHTPGHAPGHLCFIEADLGIGVVGDMVASIGTILIDPYEGDMVAYLQQLERLAGLGLTTALPAHGEPVEAPEGLFRHYIAHRLARESKVLDALQQTTTPGDGSDHGHGATLDELLPVAYADTPSLLWPLARLSLHAHLIKLVADGSARPLANDRWTSAAA